MPEPAAEGLSGSAPLTSLSDDETLFQATAREFVQKESDPHVAEMDREGVFRAELIQKFFEQGFMAIEIPKPTAPSPGSALMRSPAWTH